METQTLQKTENKTKHNTVVAALKQPLAITRELNKRSLYHFLQWSWSIFTTDEFVANWHIKFLCEELQTIAERVAEKKPKLYDLIINIPPGTTKTIVCSIVFPAWCWTRWSWMRFITSSYSADLSLESADYSRDIIQHERFKEMYPELMLRDDKNTKHNFKVLKKEYVNVGKSPRLLQGGNRYSTSVGGTLTGFHGHMLIVDDPINPKKAVSEKELKNANHWMSQTLPTRKTDKAVVPTIIIMQRLHQNDPTGFILKKEKKNVRHICLPGQIRDYRKYLKPDSIAKYYKDDLLDSNRLSWSILEELRADLGQYGFAGQVGQNPTPPGGMFKIDRINVIDQMPSEYNQENCVRYWDKAATVDAGANSVGLKMMRLRNNKFIIIDVKRGQWSSEVREQITLSAAQADGRNVTVVVEQEPGSGGKESAESTVRNLAGFTVVKDRPTGDKARRADPFSVQVNDGNVMLIRADWNKSFLDELEFFPNSEYKDQVDAAAGAFNQLTARKKVRRIT